MSDFSDVGAFTRHFGLGNVDGPPTDADPETRELRLRFLLSEVREYAEANGYDLAYTLIPAPASQQPNIYLPHVARELIDIVYVALGTAHLHRLPWSRIFRSVHRANMAKTRGLHAPDDEKLGVMKPPGWQPPDILRVLTAAGWLGPEDPRWMCNEL